MDKKVESALMELVARFADLLHAGYAGWSIGYFRFYRDSGHWGSNCSSIEAGRVRLGDAIKYSKFFEEMNKSCLALFDELKKDRGVMLISVNQRMEFRLNFEWDKLDRWQISKLNGLTGVPLDIPDPLPA